MPNHSHFVLEQTHENALRQFMQWLFTSPVRGYSARQQKICLNFLTDN